MMTVLIVSTVLLTVCVLALSVGVFVLARQIGVLHERLAPIGVQPVLAGLQAGQALPQITARTLEGAAVSVGGLNPSGRAMVLMFVSADCPVCKRTLPTARSVAKEHDLDLVLIGEGMLLLFPPWPVVILWMVCLCCSAPSCCCSCRLNVCPHWWRWMPEA